MRQVSFTVTGSIPSFVYTADVLATAFPRVSRVLLPIGSFLIHAQSAVLTSISQKDKDFSLIPHIHSHPASFCFLEVNTLERTYMFIL